jgi:uncharacterized membrane protein YgcG
VAVLAFGFVYRAVLPGAVDPWAYRFVVAGACAGGARAHLRAGRPRLLPALHALYLLFTVWVAWLLALNGFAPEYALGMVVIVAVICILFRGTRAQAAYGAVTLAMVAAVAARGSRRASARSSSAATCW